MEDGKNTHKRFCRWRDKGIWETLLEIFVKEPDMEWLMIDTSHSKVHPHASGGATTSQDAEGCWWAKHEAQSTTDAGGLIVVA